MQNGASSLPPSAPKMHPRGNMRFAKFWAPARMKSNLTCQTRTTRKAYAKTTSRSSSRPVNKASTRDPIYQIYKILDFATCALLPPEQKVKTLMPKRYLGRLGKFETEPGEQNLRFTATSASFFAHVLSAKFTFCGAKSNLYKFTAELAV